MKRIADLQEFAWIEDGRCPRATGLPVRVDHCLPGRFEAYAKIFPPILIDLSVQDRSVTWNDAEGDADLDQLAAMGEGIRALLSGSVLSRGVPDSDFPSVRIRWSELAHCYGLCVHPELNAWSLSRYFPSGSWPRYLVGPGEGDLDSDSIEELLQVLEGVVLSGFGCYDAIATVNWMGPFLFHGRLAELDGLRERPGVMGTSPTYWWPVSREWCVCTAWDLTFTLVGGTRQAIDSILASRELESIEITPQTRVDYKADQINVPDCTE